MNGTSSTCLRCGQYFSYYYAKWAKSRQLCNECKIKKRNNYVKTIKICKICKYKTGTDKRYCQSCLDSISTKISNRRCTICDAKSDAIYCSKKCRLIMCDIRRTSKVLI